LNKANADEFAEARLQRRNANQEARLVEDAPRKKKMYT
jgi:hypothetical protein